MDYEFFLQTMGVVDRLFELPPDIWLEKALPSDSVDYTMFSSSLSRLVVEGPSQGAELCPGDGPGSLTSAITPNERHHTRRYVQVRFYSHALAGWLGEQS